MRTVIFLIFLSLILLQVRGQKPYDLDSLETKLNLLGERESIKVLRLLIEGNLKGNPQKANDYARRFYDLSTGLDSAGLQAEALTFQGIVLRKITADHDQAMEYFIEAIEIYEQTNVPSIYWVNTLLEISNSFKSIGDDLQALNYLLSAKAQTDEIRNDSLQTAVLFELAYAYERTGDIDQAMRYLQSAADLIKRTDMKNLFRLYYFHKAQLLANLGNLSQALLCFDSAETFSGRKANPPQSYVIGLNKGKVEFQLGKLEEAHGTLLNAATEASLKKDRNVLVQLNNTLGMVLLNQNMTDSAFYFMKEGLKGAVALNDKLEIRDAYENLYQYYLVVGEAAVAEEYKDLFIEISEFISTEQTGRKMIMLQRQYDLSKKEAEIDGLKKDAAIQQLQIENQQTQRRILLTILVFTLLLAGVGFILFRIKRQSNKKLSLVNEKIERQNEELQALNATKDKFFSIIGHDVKGPINSLTSFSNLLINHSGALSEQEIKQLAIDLDKSLKNLYNLLENLLHWARAQTGNVNIQKEAILVTTLFEENVELLSPSASKKNISLEMSGDLTGEIRADRNTINTVIRNLLSNAIKFTPEGGRITLECKEWEDAVELVVRDNGVGMPPQVMDNLFKIDVKHSTTGTNKEKGTGLGLILCKEFIELNGGTIRVESKEAAGSAFFVVLPKT
jgi:signal transduction histidine kinase